MQALKPARTEAEPGVKILLDFDALLKRRVGFKMHGKTYIINDIDVGNYMEVTAAYRDIVEIVSKRSQGEEVDRDEIYERYYKLVHELCPEFSYADLRALNFSGLNHLLSLIFRQIAGDPALTADDAQKKNPLI
jgi:hypothetical protein